MDERAEQRPGPPGPPRRCSPWPDDPSTRPWALPSLSVAATNLEWFAGRIIRIGPRWVQGDDQQWRKVELHERFLQQLRDRDDLRLEIRHAERDRFAILELTEAQRRLAGETKPQDKQLPEPSRLAAAVRGFSGEVAGIVRGKNDDGTIRFEVVEVLQVWKDSKAAKPEVLVGTIVRVAPQWVQSDSGRWQPQELHGAFLRKLAVGESGRIELRNDELDHFHILEVSASQREWARARAPK